MSYIVYIYVCMRNESYLCVTAKESQKKKYSTRITCKNGIHDFHVIAKVFIAC